MERTAPQGPRLPAAGLPSRSRAPQQRRRFRQQNRMSVSDRLAPANPRVASSRCPLVSLSPPLSLSSPVIKKKVIQIPSFDEKGLIYDKRDTKPSTDRSFIPIGPSKTSIQPNWTKTSGDSLGRHGNRASTPPRTESKAHSSPALSAKPGASLCLSPKTDSSPTHKPKPKDSLRPPASQLRNPPPSLHQPKPSVSPTLTVPTPRLSPSPTSQETSLDSRGGKQPSPVAKERQARSIAISNAGDEPKLVKRDILDLEAFLGFTHTALMRARPMSHSQAYSELQRQAATHQNFGLSQLGLSEKGNIAEDKPGPPPGGRSIFSIPKPMSNLKQQQELLPSGAAGTQASLSACEGIRFARVFEKKSLPAFDVPDPRPSADFPQRRNLTSSEHSYELKSSERRAASPTTPRMLFPSLNQSPNVESRRRRFDLNDDTRFSSHGKRPEEENNTRTITGSPSKLSQQTSASRYSKSPQNYRFWSKAPVPASLSDCVSVDHRCQSRDIDCETESRWCAYRSTQFKLGPQTQETSRPASVDDATSKSTHSKPDFISHSRPDPKQNKSHKEVTFGDPGLNKTDLFDHHRAPAKLLEYPRDEYRLFDTNSLGVSSKGVSGPLRHTASQRPEETTTAASPPLPSYPRADRAFIMEDPEDPYYVTMYYPGSVYVDMSDIVPPEVRPKPAVPAKPPNVGAPSPSSPFPPQGPGIGGGASALPPSAIPVPIGSHVASHAVGHNVGHGAGHVGGLAAAHNGGHGHAGAHRSGGGSTLLGYIGIDTIIEQMRKKTMKAGFDFNIMVVGNSGLGKSTLVNTLFKSQVSRRSAGWARDEKIPKTIEIKAVSHVLEEGGVKMKLTVVDTPGFGDQINNDNCWEPISKYINEQYEKFLKEEVNITRKKRIPDTRVHCCIYFITPTGHSLRSLDIEFMKRLSHSVNIIPVIAKSDTMTIEERLEFKQRVRKELEMGGIEVYPQKEFDEDMEDKSDNDKIREAMPFAVVGSDKEYQVNGKRVLGRKTAWGIVEVENPNHCEFAQLRDFLIRSHLQDLKEVTHNIHYETYRAKRLNENGGLHPITCNDTQESNL